MKDEIRPYGPGKFDTIIDSYVYDVSMDGCDEETGSVDETGHWYGLLRGTISGMLPAEELSERMNSAERAFLATQAGAIISEDSQGFVHVEYFDTEKELDAAWAEIQAEQDTLSEA